MTFAARTAVPVDRSKAEIEKLLTRYGADKFVQGWEEGQAVIGFRCSNRMVQFGLPLPNRSDWRNEQAYEQELRRLWRSLALVIKAKLEAVATGITTFEQEFLAHIVMPDGRTVGQHVAPKIAAAYETGKMPRLLPGPGETS